MSHANEWVRVNGSERIENESNSSSQEKETCTFHQHRIQRMQTLWKFYF